MSKTNADAVAERRLRPIYDWLDNGNNKKAIQEADKVLKKQPDLLCAKVLKGLALLRLGKNKDCEEILENVQKEVPADDCTLQAMTICYRELHKLENICDVYEKAVLKDPHNEELNTHLFMSYVRIGDYKKQQQVALNLYKMKPKNPYYFWGVMSILMQAKNSEEKIAQKVMLPLAERMVKKFIDEGKIEAEQEIQLFLMILEMQKKYQNALDVIDSDLGQKVMSYYMFSRKRIKLLQLLEKWRDLNVYTKKIILEEPDAYNYYVIYIECVFKLMNSENKLQTDMQNCSLSDSSEGETLPNAFNTHKGEILKPDDTIEQCVKFIKRCQKENESPHRLRGPHLALLLLYRRLSEDHLNPSKYLGNPLDLLTSYFELFGEKACCFKDLHQFLPLMQNDYISLLSSTWVVIRRTDEGEVKNEKQMMLYLTHFEISRYSGIYEKFSVNDKLTQISRLLDFYHDGHRFNVDMIPTDLGCSDTFMILVVHSLYDLYVDTNDLKFIKDAICLLEYAYNFSSSNHHFKLLLLKLYNKLGASKAGYKYFQLLEIKHMQYDSLGYLECWSLLYSGQYSLAVHLLDNTLKFFNINYKETADQLTHAYKYGSFEKVNEFLSFREKLKNSFHYSLVTIEHLIHDIIHLPSHDLTVQTAQHISINPEKPAGELDHLVDNRDIYLFLCFDSDSRRMNETFAKLSFSHEISLIRLRTIILRCIGASINVSLFALPLPKMNQTTNSENSPEHSNGIDGTCSRHLDTFFNVIEELREMYKSFLENPAEELPKAIFSGVEPSRLFLYTKSSFFLPLFIDVMSFAHEFCSHCLTSSSTEKKLEQIAEISASAFSKLIFDCNSRLMSVQSCCDEVDHRDLFEYLSLVIEIICIMCIVCGNFCSILMASSKKAPVLAKRKKKKKEGIVSSSTVNEDSSNQVEQGVLKIFAFYLSIVKDNIKTFEIHLSHLESYWMSLENLETHKPGFELRRWQSHDKEPDLNPVFGISDQRWFQIQSNVNDNLRDSFKSSLKQFRNMIKHKIEYLSLLSC